MTSAGLPWLGGLVYRDQEHGWIFGVCAGIADRFDLAPALVRVLSCLALALYPVAGLVGYAMAGLLLPPKRLHFHGRGLEAHFWRRTDSSSSDDGVSYG